MTVLRPLEFVNFAVQGDNGRNTLHLLCQFISTSWNSLVPDNGFWAVNWTQEENSKNVITLRTIANVLDKRSVRISLSTMTPQNLLVVLSYPFCRSRFVSLAGNWLTVTSSGDDNWSSGSLGLLTDKTKKQDV